MNFGEFLIEANVLRFGDFTLKSGTRSPYFLNFGEICQGRHLAILGDALAEVIQIRVPEATVILGPPYKAIAMAVTTAIALHHRGFDCSTLTFRKEAKQHGEGGDFLGHRLRGRERIVLVDDVMSSGQTKLDAVAKVEAEARRLGFEPPRFEAVVVGVDRQEVEQGRTAAEAFSEKTGIPVYAVATIRELASQLAGRLLDVQHQALQRYLRS